MREISGKVVLEGSGDGLIDVAVVAFHVGEQATALFTNGGLEGKPESLLAEHQLLRLGSVLTGRRGEFRLTCDDEEPPSQDRSSPPGRRRRDWWRQNPAVGTSGRGTSLAIVLIAPATGGERCGRIIGTSCGVRPGAAAVEAVTFVVPKTALTP